MSSWVVFCGRILLPHLNKQTNKHGLVSSNIMLGESRFSLPWWHVHTQQRSDLWPRPKSVCPTLVLLRPGQSDERIKCTRGNRWPRLSGELPQWRSSNRANQRDVGWFAGLGQKRASPRCWWESESKQHRSFTSRRSALLVFRNASQLRCVLLQAC